MPLAFAGVAAAGHVTLRSAQGNAAEQAAVGLATFQVTFNWYREFAPADVANCPEPSKYNVVFVPNVIPNCAEVVFAFGVARKSATTAAMMFAAAVCDVALRFVCTPMGMRPKTASKQKPAMPKASVTSTSENAATLKFRRFMAGKPASCRSLEQSVLPHDFPRLDSMG